MNLLFPDFTCQVAQFCEEVELRYDLPESAVRGRYGQRLVRWWDEWSRASASGSPKNPEDECRDANKAFEALVLALKEVKGLAHADAIDRGRAQPVEVLRAELWVRAEPTTERRLTMWANTAGPILDRDELEGNARQSLKSTSNSRPFRHIPRWVSYLAVPITVDVGEGRVTVGVVTISSTLTREESLLRADAATMAKIVATLSQAGKELPEMQDLVPVD